jgi:hypothetical protein
MRVNGKCDEGSSNILERRGGQGVRSTLLLDRSFVRSSSSFYES